MPTILASILRMFIMKEDTTIHISNKLMNSIRKLIPSANKRRIISMMKNRRREKFMYLNKSVRKTLSSILSVRDSSVRITMHSRMTIT